MIGPAGFMQAPKMQAHHCECRRCIREKSLTGAGGLPLDWSQMIVCPTCGNKRCPAASDHTLACTGSNAPNQRGSVYGGVKA